MVEVKRPSRAELFAALEAVLDPHVPVSLRAMGMLQDATCDAHGNVRIKLCMPCMACPATSKIEDDIQHAVGALPGVVSIDVDLGWETRWDRDSVAPHAREIMRRAGILI